MAADLQAALLVLGLEEYLPRFLDSGFEDWEALTKIAETQLSLLDVRLGHRRRLQRAIATERLWPENTPLPLAPDLNQRIRDWLREEACLSLPAEDSESSDWPSQTSQTPDPALIHADLVGQGLSSQSSSDESSSQTVHSDTKVLSGLKTNGAPCLDLEDHPAGSESPLTLSTSDHKAVERGVT